MKMYFTRLLEMKKLFLIYLFCLISSLSFAQYLPPTSSGSFVISGSPLVGYVPVGRGSTAAWLQPPIVDVAAASPPVVCDGTDQSSNLAALLTTYAATGAKLQFHGGAGCVYRFNSSIVLPNDGTTQPGQPTFVFEGTGAYTGSNGGTVFDLRSSNVNGQIQTYGGGLLEFNEITLTNLGTSTGTPFILTTGTTVDFHNSAIFGAANACVASSNQDAIVFGGTSTTFSGGPTAPFSGYGTRIYDSTFGCIRRAAYMRVFANGITFTNNNLLGTNGSNFLGLTAVPSIANGGGGFVVGDVLTGVGGTNESPFQVTVASLSGSAIATVTISYDGNYTAAPSNPITLTGGTGTGATLNGTFAKNGAAIEMDGTGAGNSPGGTIAGNDIRVPICEQPSYAYCVKVNAGTANLIQVNSFDGIEAYAANPITGLTWASGSGGRYTFAVTNDLTKALAAGATINVAGVVSTFAINPNGAWVVVSVTSNTIVVTAAGGANAGSYTSGGSVAAGGTSVAVVHLMQSSNNNYVSPGLTMLRGNGSCCGPLVKDENPCAPNSSNPGAGPNVVISTVWSDRSCLGGTNFAGQIAATGGIASTSTTTGDFIGNGMGLTGALWTGGGINASGSVAVDARSGNIPLQWGQVGNPLAQLNWNTSTFATVNSLPGVDLGFGTDNIVRMTLKSATGTALFGGLIAPSMTSTLTCGSGCTSVTGNPQKVSAVTGTAQTSITVNFGITWPAAPICVPVGDSLAATLDATTTTTAVTFGASVALTGATIRALCF